MLFGDGFGGCVWCLEVFVVWYFVCVEFFYWMCGVVGYVGCGGVD